MQATGREFLVLVRPFLVPFADANERGLKKRVHGKDSGDLGACFEVGGGAWPPGHPCSAVPERDYSPCQTATRDDENWKSRMVTAL